MPIAGYLIAAWLGGALLFAAVVAPAAFAVLPSRSLAGALVGRVLPVLFLSGLVIALVALWLGRGDATGRSRVRQVALALIAVSCAVAQFAVAPRIARVRAEIGGTLEALPAGDPRRAAFGRLHAISVAWLALAMGSAVVAIVVAARAGRTQPLAERSHPFPTSR